jgi:hypothetical protein
MVNPDHDATLEQAASLETSMTNLTNELHTLHQKSRRQGRVILGLIVSIVFDVALSVVIWLVAVQARDASSLATHNRLTQIVTCESGNQARAAQVQLWDFFLHLAGQTNPSPQKTEQIEKFRSYVGQTFAQRDCQASPTQTPRQN